MKKILTLLLIGIFAFTGIGPSSQASEQTTVQHCLVRYNSESDYDDFGDNPGGRGGYCDPGYYGGGDYDYSAGPLERIWNFIDGLFYDDYDGYYDDGYYDDDYYSDDYYSDDYYSDDYYSDDYYDEDVVAVFSVENGALSIESGDASSDDLSTYNKMWERVALIIPDTYENMIVKFEISTDGTDGTLAYVYNEDSSLKTWTISLDPADVVLSNGNLTSDFDETVIHEFGHLLTLNNYQMDSSAQNTYVTYEGTLKQDSYLNLFYAAFWADIMDEYRDVVGNDAEENGYLFYEGREDMFVDDYAAESPEEDIAESFSSFVLEDKPTGSQIKDQKVAFFYQFDELVSIRDAIRANIMS